MRVAHILRKYVPAEWGGTETALQRLGQGLAAHEVRSVVYCPDAPKVAGPDPLAAAGCEVRRFHACLPVLGLPRATRDRLVSVGGNILSFDLPWMLRRERDLDVIHTHTLGRIGGIAGSAARRRDIPFVVSIHGGVMDPPPSAPADAQDNARGVEWGRVFGWWWRAHHVLEEADAILTCNTREAELLRERYPNQLIAVQPHGVSTALFRADQRAAARAAFPSIAGREVLLTVARVDPVKNQLWVVRQLPRIAARHPKILLVMAGACTNAAYGAELQREVARLGLEQHVLLTGGLPPGDPRVVGLMQEARVAILPSITETFGLVILEAWAAGLAALASRTSGALGLVRDGENGALFSLDNPDEFHAKLERLLHDREAHARAVAGGSRGAGEYDIAVLAGRVRDLYARLIAKKQPGKTCATSFYATTTPAR